MKKLKRWQYKLVDLIPTISMSTFVLFRTKMKLKRPTKTHFHIPNLSEKWHRNWPQLRTPSDLFPWPPTFQRAIQKPIHLRNFNITKQPTCELSVAYGATGNPSSFICKIVIGQQFDHLISNIYSLKILASFTVFAAKWKNQINPRDAESAYVIGTVS